MDNNFSRRKFITTTGTVLAGSMLINEAVAGTASLFSGPKKRYAMVGTGHRGTGMWGKDIISEYGDYV